MKKGTRVGEKRAESLVFSSPLSSPLVFHLHLYPFLPHTHQNHGPPPPGTAVPALDARMIPTISPYSASASAKIRIRIMPTNSLGCCALARTPASPTTPMAMPAASPARPQASPEARWA